MRQILRTFIGLAVAGLTAFPHAGAAAENLRLAATVGVYRSGLLNVLDPVFEAAHSARIEVTAVSGSNAVQLGEKGKVDVLLLPASPATDAFMTEGYGARRRAVMHSDFVIVGPQADPAKVSEAGTAAAAFQRIAQSGAQFVSAAAGSATYKKELAIWQAAGITTRGNWYLRTARSSRDMLLIADDKQAYALINRATYLAYEKKLDLAMLYRGDPALCNPYQLIVVNPDKHPTTKATLGLKYLEFLTGAEGRKLIAEFRVGGKQLFYPDAPPAP